MNSMNKAVIRIAFILILCTPILVYSDDEGVRSTEADNSKLTIEPVNVKEEKSSIKPEQKNKLIAWWKFENNLNDSAGTNPGIIGGSPTYISGKFGQAISLDGDDYVDCGKPSLLDFGTESWTVSAWIKTTQGGTDEDDEHMNRGTVFANGADERGGIRYALIMNETMLDRVTLVTDDNIVKVQVTARTIVNDGSWHHIVGMRNVRQLSLYVDGVLDGKSNLPEGYDLSGASEHNTYIGVITDNRDDSLYKYFAGSIDEVCVFACALDANSVGALYSGRDPMKVAEEAKDVVEPLPRPLQIPAIDDDTRGTIEDDWQVISEKGGPAVIKIRREANGTLSAFAVDEGPNGDSEIFPLDEVTFENGKFRFEVISEQIVFEGTMKEDGSTIEGQLQGQEEGQIMAFVLKRIDAVTGQTAQTPQEQTQKRINDTSETDAPPSQTAQTQQEQSQGRISGTRNIATTLILILVLVGIVGLIVIFFVKARIR